MRQSVKYGLLLAVPAGTAMGSGVFLTTTQRTLGLAMGLGVGVLVFGLVVLGREYGSADEGRRDGP